MEVHYMYCLFKWSWIKPSSHLSTVQSSSEHLASSPLLSTPASFFSASTYRTYYFCILVSQKRPTGDKIICLSAMDTVEDENICVRSQAANQQTRCINYLWNKTSWRSGGQQAAGVVLQEICVTTEEDIVLEDCSASRKSALPQKKSQ